MLTAEEVKTRPAARNPTIWVVCVSDGCGVLTWWDFGFVQQLDMYPEKLMPPRPLYQLYSRACMILPTKQSEGMDF